MPFFFSLFYFWDSFLLANPCEEKVLENAEKCEL